MFFFFFFLIYFSFVKYLLPLYIIIFFFVYIPSSFHPNSNHGFLLLNFFLSPATFFTLFLPLPKKIFSPSTILLLLHIAVTLSSSALLHTLRLSITSTSYPSPFASLLSLSSSITPAMYLSPTYLHFSPPRPSRPPALISSSLLTFILRSSAKNPSRMEQSEGGVTLGKSRSSSLFAPPSPLPGRVYLPRPCQGLALSHRCNGEAS